MDSSTRVAFLRDFQRFSVAERERSRCWQDHPTRYRVDSVDAARHWMARHRESLTGLGADLRAALARWVNPAQETSAAGRRRTLDDLVERATRLATETVDANARGMVAALVSAALAPTHSLAEAATEPAGLLGHLNPMRALRRYRLRRLLSAHGSNGFDADMLELRTAAQHEVALRGLKRGLIEIDLALGVEAEPRDGADARTLVRLAREHIARLERVAPIARAISECPAGPRPPGPPPAPAPRGPSPSCSTGSTMPSPAMPPETPAGRRWHPCPIGASRPCPCSVRGLAGAMVQGGGRA